MAIPQLSEFAEDASMAAGGDLVERAPHEVGPARIVSMDETESARLREYDAASKYAFSSERASRTSRLLRAASVDPDMTGSASRGFEMSVVGV